MKTFLHLPNQIKWIIYYVLWYLLRKKRKPEFDCLAIIDTGDISLCVPRSRRDTLYTYFKLSRIPNARRVGIFLIFLFSGRGYDIIIIALRSEKSWHYFRDQNVRPSRVQVYTWNNIIAYVCCGISRGPRRIDPVDEKFPSPVCPAAATDGSVDYSSRNNVRGTTYNRTSPARGQIISIRVIIP